MKPPTPEQLQQQLSLFRAIVRQMPALQLTIDAQTVVALVAQVQLAACHPLNKTPLAMRAQDAARDFIRQFPAPAAAFLHQQWNAPGFVQAEPLSNADEKPWTIAMTLGLATSVFAVALARMASKARLGRFAAWMLCRAMARLQKFDGQLAARPIVPASLSK